MELGLGGGIVGQRPAAAVPAWSREGLDGGGESGHTVGGGGRGGAFKGM